MSNGIYLFNQFYAFASLLAVFFSLWLFSPIKNRFGLKFTLSLLCGASLSLLASILPSLAFMLTISFVPSFIYHMIDPLAIAPFVIGLVGFVAGWCVQTLLIELQNFLVPDVREARLNMLITAFFIFLFMSYAMRSGMSGYRIIFHAQQISHYAPTGTDPRRLKEIFY